ncbi:hypothetical protein BRC68_01920, partial [Halobacteriales archaeon QH_6_64_20]
KHALGDDRRRIVTVVRSRAGTLHSPDRIGEQRGAGNGGETAGEEIQRPGENFDALEAIENDPDGERQREQDRRGRENRTAIRIAAFVVARTSRGPSDMGSLGRVVR